MWDRWVSTVRREMDRRRPISMLVSPWITSRTTSSSVGVRLSHPSDAGGGPPFGLGGFPPPAGLPPRESNLEWRRRARRSRRPLPQRRRFLAAADRGQGRGGVLAGAGSLDRARRLLVGGHSFDQGVGVAVQEAATPGRRCPPAGDGPRHCGLVHRLHHGPSQLRTSPADSEADKVRSDADQLRWDPESGPAPAVSRMLSARASPRASRSRARAHSITSTPYTDPVSANSRSARTSASSAAG
jgi:hypothetical protein